MRLVANGTTGRPEMIAADEAAAWKPKRISAEVSGYQDARTCSRRQKDIDYLDIPSFLRTQAD